MKKTFLVPKILGLVLFISINAQAQDFSIKSADVNLVPCTELTPVIDGEIDELWDRTGSYDIKTAYGNETVSMMASPTWQAVWDDEAFYLLVKTFDDDYLDYKTAGVQGEWLADLVEVYFDVNAVKVDNNGPNPNDESNYPSAGHHQIALNEPDGNTRTDGVEWAIKIIDDKTIINEYKIPFSALTTNNGEAYDPYLQPTIGFDITIIDLDEEGVGGNSELGRVNYSNNTVDAVEGGWATESWNCLDQSADLTFHDYSWINCNSITEQNASSYILVHEIVSDNLEFRENVSELIVYDTNGKVVAENKNVSHLKPGLYFVIAETKFGDVVNNFIKL